MGGSCADRTSRRPAGRGGTWMPALPLQGHPRGPTRVDPQEKSGGSETGALLRSALRSSLFPGLGNRTPSGSAGWAGREGEVNKVEEEDCLGTARC